MSPGSRIPLKIGSENQFSGKTYFLQLVPAVLLSGLAHRCVLHSELGRGPVAPVVEPQVDPGKELRIPARLVLEDVGSSLWSWSPTQWSMVSHSVVVYGHSLIVVFDNQLIVHCVPDRWSSDIWSFRLYGKFLVDPKQNRLSYSNIFWIYGHL